MKEYRNPVFSDPQDPEPILENDSELPSSGEEAKVTIAPSPEKRRGVQKRVVSVPIGDMEGPKGKGDGYPPSDSWNWRKYGQKPIKGSPYPRGYYRCSSSKACPARKQVERNRLDPRMLIITYACDHNHPMPTTKGPHPATIIATSPATEPKLPAPSEELTAFASQAGLELSNNSAALLGDSGWFDYVASSTTVLESSICVGHSDYMNADGAMRLDDGDENLFTDLGELPEGSVFFRHRMLISDEQNQRCSVSVVTTG